MNVNFFGMKNHPHGLMHIHKYTQHILMNRNSAWMTMMAVKNCEWMCRAEWLESSVFWCANFICLPLCVWVGSCLCVLWMYHARAYNPMLWLCHTTHIVHTIHGNPNNTLPKKKEQTKVVSHFSRTSEWRSPQEAAKNKCLYIYSSIFFCLLFSAQDNI